VIGATAKQREIRDHRELNLLVVAPAGCGKTEALALRVAGLLDRGQVPPPERILVTTFTNRARDNIRTRLKGYVSATAMRDQISVLNFHGLSARIFRAHAEVLGLDSAMTIPESNWVKEQCQSRGLTRNASSAVEDALRFLKHQALTDEEIDRRLDHGGHTIALEIERQRRAEGRLTYDDLPRLAELLLANAEVAKLYQQHFAAVIVDEYQDLTPQQLRIVQRIGWRRTTYAGDLAQGIFRFAGADPEVVDKRIRSECTNIIEFAESHRSSPAVLGVVNALTSLTNGMKLSCADAASWPSGGLASGASFETVKDESAFVVRHAGTIMENAPKQRIGIIARTEGRRRFVDHAVVDSGLPHFRWDDPFLDSETAKALKAFLRRLDLTAFAAATDRLAYLRQTAKIEQVQDPGSRQNLADAIGWCLDLLDEGKSPDAIRARVRIGDQDSLLDVPGLHLLSGHVGKGQQFDWVFIVGLEDGTLPDFRDRSAAAVAEEARVLSVMVSRARHGVVVTYAKTVPAWSGEVYPKSASPFVKKVAQAPLTKADDLDAWFGAADWTAIAKR
jgi:DNA helicase-2/ATP-dependent DNA helicase PcrA